MTNWNKIMKKHIIATAVLATLLSGAVMAQQAEGPWLVRVRAVHLQPSNSDSANLGLSINSKWLPEVDFNYYFSKSVSAELILTVPQKQTVSLPTGAVGTLRHLPPTLTVKYHFDTGPSFTPYVGIGANYTRFSSVSLAGGTLDVKRSSTGLAYQAGVDIPISKGTYLNFDVKKVQIKTDVSVVASGAKLSTFKVDPVLFGVGVGWRF